MWPMIAASALKFGYDKYHADLDRQAEAQKEMYSPWTGYQGKDVAKANLMGDMMGGATAGMQMDQAKQNQDQSSQLSSAMSNYYNSKSAAPGSFGAMDASKLRGQPQLGDYNMPATDPELLKYGRMGA